MGSHWGEELRKPLHLAVPLEVDRFGRWGRTGRGTWSWSPGAVHLLANPRRRV